MIDYSTRFSEAFNRSYAMTRRLYSAEQWERVWKSGDAWNHVMLWNPHPPQTLPVLEMVAIDMGLQYWNVGEPLRPSFVSIISDWVQCRFRL